MPREGDVIAGKYRVDGVVGRGGMGVVLSAEHLQLKQQVALKVLLLSGLDDARRKDACARFLKEGQAAARLTSDHVVRIFDVGTLDDGAPFLVMELLRGDDLATVVRRQGAAPVEVALDYVAQACDAIGEAHALGIVHRDLKPSNLFVCRRNDGRALIKVLDFGISKVLREEDDPFEGNLTATRAVVGSPLYMSPEQLRDAKRVDPRTDIWSLGMILYELITGGPAFYADTLLGLTAAVAADAPVPPRVRRPDISEALDHVVLRCLEKDPAKRFQSISGLVEAILPLVPKVGAESSAEYASRRLESVLEAAAERVRRDYPTFRVPELQSPPNADGPFSATAASVPEGMRQGSEPPPNPDTPPTKGVPSTRSAPPSAPSGPDASQRSSKVRYVTAEGSTTLVSSTGSTVRPASEPGAPLAAKEQKQTMSAALWIALAAVLLGVGAWFVISPSSKDSREAQPPTPAAPPPRATEPPPTAAPSLAPAPSETAAPPAASQDAPPAVSPGAAVRHRHPGASPAGKKPPPAGATSKPSDPDIRLER